MNQYRINYGKARIIRIEKIKASESLCWVWREGIVRGGTEKRGSYCPFPFKGREFAIIRLKLGMR